MADIHFNGRPVRYEWFPAHGKPKGNLLLLHSIGLSLEDSDPFVPYARQNYNVLRYDLLGHGPSAQPDEPTTIRLLLEQLGWISGLFFQTPFAIVANNVSGLLASRFCRLHNERVTALIMISPPPACLPLHSRLDIAAQMRDKAEDDFGLYKQFMLSHMTSTQDADALSSLRTSFDRIRRHAYFDLMRSFVKEEFNNDFPHVNAPILVLSGASDRWIPLSLYGVTASYFGAVRLETLSDASNLVAFDNPSGAAAAIDKFLDEIASGNIAESGLRVNAGEIAGALRSGFAGVDRSRRLTVDLLHTFRVRIGDAEMTRGWNVRKAKSLLIYLLLHRTVRREELIDLFWPELEIGKARNLLRVSLNHLKTILNRDDGESFLYIDREHVFLQGGITCDALDYLHQLATAHNEPNPTVKLTLARQVLDIEPYMLLMQLYDDWFLRIRESLETQYCALCEWTARHLRESGQPDKAKAYTLKAARMGFSSEDNPYIARRTHE